MGGGLGGGSTDAAAVLLGASGADRQAHPSHQLHDLAASLGSDVPFFLYGGTALGIRPRHGTLPAPGCPIRSAGSDLPRQFTSRRPKRTVCSNRSAQSDDAGALRRARPVT